MLRKWNTKTKGVMTVHQLLFDTTVLINLLIEGPLCSFKSIELVNNQNKALLLIKSGIKPENILT